MLGWAFSLDAVAARLSRGEHLFRLEARVLSSAWPASGRVAFAHALGRSSACPPWGVFSEAAVPPPAVDQAGVQAAAAGSEPHVPAGRSHDRCLSCKFLPVLFPPLCGCLPMLLTFPGHAFSALHLRPRPTPCCRHVGARALFPLPVLLLGSRSQLQVIAGQSANASSTCSPQTHQLRAPPRPVSRVPGWDPACLLLPPLLDSLCPSPVLG